MTTNNDTNSEKDFERFTKERKAASELRAEVAFAIGFASPDNPEISEMLEKALKKHDQNREQYWF